MKFVAGLLVGIFVAAMYFDTASTKQAISDTFDWITVEISSIGS